MSLPIILFHFLRGAIKSKFGIENLREKSILIVGMDRNQQELMSFLCLAGVNLKFSDKSITNYSRGINVCLTADVYNQEGVDIIIDIPHDLILVKDKVCKISTIKKEDPYNDGFHTFYI